MELIDNWGDTENAEASTGRTQERRCHQKPTPENGLGTNEALRNKPGDEKGKEKQQNAPNTNRKKWAFEPLLMTSLHMQVKRLIVCILDWKSSWIYVA